MSKASIGISGFILGVCCSAGLFSVGQAKQLKDDIPQINWPHEHFTIEGGSARGGGAAEGVSLSGLWTVPMFNTLDNLPVIKRFEFSNELQRLDGLNCTDCVFKDVRLLYGGGAVDIRGSNFSGTTEIQLEGAAANTVALLEFLKALPNGRLKYKLPIPNKPITRKAIASPPRTMDFTAPYIGPR